MLYTNRSIVLRFSFFLMEANMSNKVRRLLTAYLTDEEWEILKNFCADDERSMASAVTRIIRAWIDIKREEQK